MKAVVSLLCWPCLLFAEAIDLSSLGTASQSTTASSYYGADRAIDADIWTQSRTDNSTVNNWWELDFGAPYAIHALEIEHADEWRPQRLKNLTLRVLDAARSNLFTDTISAGVLQWDSVLPAPVLGRYVRVSLEGGAVNGFGGRDVRLGEVRVFGAPFTASWEADPYFITGGGSSILRWDVALADAVSIEPGIGPVAASGSLAVSPLVATEYTLRMQRGTNEWTRTLTVGVDQPLPAVLISEFVADNDGSLRDADGEASDWIELFNPGPADIDLSGYVLSDKPGVATWTFPSVIVPANGFLVVFASGKNRTGAELHTNFELDRSGEYLAVLSPTQTVIDAYSPDYPNQIQDLSYGYGFTPGGFGTGFFTPTAGAPNQGWWPGFVRDTRYTPNRGFYTNSILVTVTCDTPNVTFAYTTDGSEPGPSNGVQVAASAFTLSVSNTTPLRAMAYREGWKPSNVDTHTYLFPADVATQVQPTNYPSGFDYEVDPDVVGDPRYAGHFPSVLYQVPSLSIVMHQDDLFDDAVGIYANNYERGIEWERPCSVEWMEPAGADNQIDCGIRLHGASARNPPKHTFKLMFKRTYGAGRWNYPLFDDTSVQSFDRLVIRHPFNDAWLIGGQAKWRDWATYTKDMWAARCQRAMGHPAPSHRWTHVYLNGLYWGLYELVELPRDAFASEHIGGEPEEYDIFNHYGLLEGQIDAFHTMYDIAEGGGPFGAISNQAAYAHFQEYMAVTPLIDYILLNAYISNGDWPNNNFYQGRRRVYGGQSHYFSWDAEFGMTDEGSLTNDFIRVLRNDSFGAGYYYTLLKANEEFRLTFADRMQRHFRGCGLLTPGPVSNFFGGLFTELETLLVAESARWGDTHRATPYNPIDDWAPQRDWITTNWFPRRTDILWNQFKQDGMIPDLDAPEAMIDGASHCGGLVATGSIFTLQSGAGDIYFTTDGVDPRLTGGAISSNAQLYTGQIELDDSIWLQARVYSNGLWSPLVDQTYITGTVPADTNNFVISEIHFNPLGSDETEFLEFMNIGLQAVDPEGLTITNAVRFTFPPGLIVPPGGLLVVVENLSAFESLYGPGPPVAGQWSGGLGNGGETISVTSAEGGHLFSVAYADQLPWPVGADGSGPSVELMNPAAVPGPQPTRDIWLSDGFQWSASCFPGGTPGAAFFPCDSPLLSANHDGSLSWPAEIGGVYELEANDDLRIGLWTVIAELTAADSPITFVDPELDSRGLRHYRVRRIK